MVWACHLPSFQNQWRGPWLVSCPILSWAWVRMSHWGQQCSLIYKQRGLKQTEKMALVTQLGNLILCSAKALYVSERRYEPCLHAQVCPMSLEITIGSLIFLSWHVSAWTPLLTQDNHRDIRNNTGQEDRNTCKQLFRQNRKVSVLSSAWLLKSSFPHSWQVWTGHLFGDCLLKETHTVNEPWF